MAGLSRILTSSSYLSEIPTLTVADFGIETRIFDGRWGPGSEGLAQERQQNINIQKTLNSKFRAHINTPKSS
jgi:hypothetical protein